MSPRRYRPSFEARPIFEGMPRTKVDTPAFQLTSGVVLFAVGLIMFQVHPPEGEWTPGTLTCWNAGAWAGAIAGGVLLFAAFQSLARARARVRAFAAGSPDAWRLDYDWNPGAIRDRAVAAAAEAVLWIAMSGTLGVAALLFSYGGDPLVRVVSLCLVGLSALCAWMSSGALRQGLLFGESVLRWDGGGPLRAGTEWTGSVAVAERVTAPYAHLQFVKEVKTGSGDTVAYTRREHDRVDLAARLERGTDGRKILRLTASLPADAPATELSRDPARYWELRVADDASGWATTFLVPVYR